MKPYIWTEISMAEVEGYINKALEITNKDGTIRGKLIDVYEDGFHMEIGEGHFIFVDYDTYVKDDTVFRIVEVIDFPDSSLHE